MGVHSDSRIFGAMLRRRREEAHLSREELRSPCLSPLYPVISGGWSQAVGGSEVPLDGDQGEGN
jgi:hypothetical protein